jgi:hypothetical protein
MMKLCAFAFAIALSLSVAAGCGGDDDDSASSTGDSSTTTDASTVTTTTTEAAAPRTPDGTQAWGKKDGCLYESVAGYWLPEPYCHVRSAKNAYHYWVFPRGESVNEWVYETDTRAAQGEAVWFDRTFPYWKKCVVRDCENTLQVYFVQSGETHGEWFSPDAYAQTLHDLSVQQQAAQINAALESQRAQLEQEIAALKTQLEEVQAQAQQQAIDDQQEAQMQDTINQNLDSLNGQQEQVEAAAQQAATAAQAQSQAQLDALNQQLLSQVMAQSNAALSGQFAQFPGCSDATSGDALCFG